MAKENNYSTLSLMEWKGAVGAKIDIIADNQKTLFRSVDDVKQRLATIEGKAAAYGALAGAAVGIVIFLAKHVMGAK